MRNDLAPALSSGGQGTTRLLTYRHASRDGGCSTGPVVECCEENSGLRVRAPVTRAAS